MDKSLEELGIAKNQPLYVYQQPMFDLRVSVVLIEDNGVIVMDTGDSDGYHFPGGKVRASQETIQFSAVRQIKEQTGIVLKKDALIPVDFRSSPERSPEGNVVDIGMVCMLQNSFKPSANAKWLKVDFEKKCFTDDWKLDDDHDVLLLADMLDRRCLMRIELINTQTAQHALHCGMDASRYFLIGRVPRRQFLNMDHLIGKEFR